MNRTELIAEARVRLDDLEEPFKYRTDSMVRWADEAVTEANRRARLLLDNTVTVNVIVGTSEYPLPANTIFIRRAKIATEDLPLKESSYRILDEDVSGWESHVGTPIEYFTDMNNLKFSLYPTPDANSNLNILTVREPTLGETIEIPTRFHYGLVDWILFRAYSVKNTDKEVRNKAGEHFALFEQEYGVKSSAKDETFQIRNRPFNNLDGTY